MTEALLSVLKGALPLETPDSTRESLTCLEEGNFKALLSSDLAKKILRTDDAPRATAWSSDVRGRVAEILDQEPVSSFDLLTIGYAALLAFLQSNITGPPLPFDVSRTLLPGLNGPERKQQDELLRQQLIDELTVDGIAAYKLTPHVELFCLAKTVLNSSALQNSPAAAWARARLNFAHQRLLSEPAGSLQEQIFRDLDAVEAHLSSQWQGDEKAQYLLERATIETFHGLDKAARQRLDEAAADRRFEFALIGALGKRTKFQKNDLSQLVVLAKSADEQEQEAISATVQSTALEAPQAIDLNDDTLLEKISFTSKNAISIDVQTSDAISPSLAALDPSDQPQLQAIDSIILLALASSITNTQAADGLTREETLPYAVRVIEGGSSNWQVYTQALLLRSRIEGYKSRTVERGLLQLQALVDQVIADTTTATSESSVPTTFLPRPSQSDSAPAQDRLRHIFQLASPNRWDLEAELAQRWVSLGGLRSALEIYERLELWAEAALCWAATEREDKARSLVRKQLYLSTSGQATSEDDDETWQGARREISPADAPRLFCILGDLDKNPAMYEMAWEVSNKRYARAMRSLGRHHFSLKDYAKAVDAYSNSLKVNQLNQATWFALGCAHLNLEQFDDAVSAFTRCVQLEETDAESWTNLAAALLRQGSNEGNAKELESSHRDQDVDGDEQPTDPQKRRKDALRALQRAATLKHDSFRIWENVMIVAASITPLDPATILTAQSNVIRLRAKVAGESCVDAEIMGKLVHYVISLSERYDPGKPGIERRVVQVVDTQIVPLITVSRPLWKMVARLAVWRNNPAGALEAYEKAWRAVTSRPGWESRDNRAAWIDVVDATIELADAYESLGPKEKTSGLAAGTGALVARDWKFKAKSTITTILGRARDEWEGAEGWAPLEDALVALKEM